MNYIKFIKSSSLKLAIIAMLFTSCDKGFEELNTNPNVYTDPIIGNLFSYSLIRGAGVGTADRNRVNIKYFAGTMQYMAALGTNWSGDKNFENGQFGDFFETVYQIHLKELQQVIYLTQDKPELANQNAIANIWRVFVMHRATDMYGDVPYSEAGLGFITGNFKPKYDKQSEIYPSMLATLEASIAKLDAAKISFGANDVIFQGSVAKWKTFAYSLMLRLGMRLSNVDANLSKQWVQKAIAGGVMKSNADVAMLKHAPGNVNTENRDAAELKRESFPESSAGKGPVKLAKTLVDMLQSYNDPRLPFYATLWEGNIIAIQAAKLPTTTAPALQKGLPNGYDASTIKSVIPNWSANMLVDYSEPNSGTISSLSAPTVLQSYAEVEFLLAEASLRGWDASSAVDHYKAGVTASMKSTALFPNNVFSYSIAQNTIDDYLTAHPLNGAGFNQQMEQLHTQFYLAHFMWLDFIEAWSNYRRTGYPTLVPPNYPGNFTGGKFLVRMRYPISEATLNKANYDAAVTAQGPDLYTTPVWWDK